MGLFRFVLGSQEVRLGRFGVAQGALGEPWGGLGVPWAPLGGPRVAPGAVLESFWGRFRVILRPKIKVIP